MDAIYTKVYLIWLVIRIVRASFTMYDDWCVQKDEDTCTRFCIPVYLTIPFSGNGTLVYGGNNCSTNIC